MRGNKPMPESEAKKKWMKENTTVITVKFMHNTEKELLDYLKAGKPATILKAALREYMENHKDK